MDGLVAKRTVGFFANVDNDDGDDDDDDDDGDDLTAMVDSLSWKLP